MVCSCRVHESDAIIDVCCVTVCCRVLNDLGLQVMSRAYVNPEQAVCLPEYRCVAVQSLVYLLHLHSCAEAYKR